MKWIGENLSFGGLIRNAGSGLGTLTKVTVEGTGMVASLFIDDPEEKQKIQNTCTTIGESIDSDIKECSAIVGKGVDYGVQKTSAGVGYVSGEAVRLMGADEETVVLAQKIGTLASAVTVGVVVGGGIADAAIAAGAAAGATGAAATTSGLAALGGGSIAAGGGGMAAGQAVVNGIVAAGGVSGAATLKDNDSA